MTDPADRTRAFARPASVRVCPVCHGPMWKKHGETCPGPRQIVAPWPPEPVRECDCPPGAWHLPDCELVGMWRWDAQPLSVKLTTTDSP